MKKSAPFNPFAAVVFTAAIVAATTLFLNPQVARAGGANISAEKMANILSSSKVAPCLAELYKLENNAEVSANSYGFSVQTNEVLQEINTTISYQIIKGDVGAGVALIIVTEKSYQISEASEGTKATQIEGCKFVARRPSQSQQ
jgi:hypothetical protein